MACANDSGISQEIFNFINQNRAHLEHTDDFEPNKVYLLVGLGNVLISVWPRLVAGGCQSCTFNLTSAFVGFEAAVAFNDFIQNYDRQVSTDDILVKGDFSKLADFGINDHTAIIDKFEAEETFKDELEQN